MDSRSAEFNDALDRHNAKRLAELEELSDLKARVKELEAWIIKLANEDADRADSEYLQGSGDAVYIKGVEILTNAPPRRV